MALLGNYSFLNKSNVTWRAGGATGQGTLRSDFNQQGRKRNIYAGWANIDKKSSFPSGYNFTDGSSAIVLPQQAGGMASSSRIVSSGVINSANGAAGYNLITNITASGVVNSAGLALIVSLVSALTGSSTVESVVSAIAMLDGTGSVLRGIGNVDSSILKANAAISTNTTGTSTIQSVVNASASASSNIIVTGEVLNTANVAAFILDAANSIEMGLTLRQALRLIVAASAGKISGSEGATVLIRNAVQDSKTRITATVDSNGNRTAITTDID